MVVFCWIFDKKTDPSKNLTHFNLKYIPHIATARSAKLFIDGLRSPEVDHTDDALISLKTRVIYPNLYNGTPLFKTS